MNGHLDLSLSSLKIMYYCFTGLHWLFAACPEHGKETLPTKGVALGRQGDGADAFDCPALFVSKQGGMKLGEPSFVIASAVGGRLPLVSPWDIHL